MLAGSGTPNEWCCVRPDADAGRPARERPADSGALPDRSVAAPVVNADNASTSRTPVPSLLLREEGLYSVLLDLIQVLDHAHAVFGSYLCPGVSTVTRNIARIGNKILYFTF